jgi:hypothetical protein
MDYHHVPQENRQKRRYTHFSDTAIPSVNIITYYIPSYTHLSWFLPPPHIFVFLTEIHQRHRAKTLVIQFLAD